MNIITSLIVITVSSVVLLSGAGSAAGSCEVISVEILEEDPINSIVTFNSTVKDPAACENGFELYVRPCNTSSNPSDFCRNVKAGIDNCPVRAGQNDLEFSLTIKRGSPRISNRCFKLPGLSVTLDHFQMVFEQTHVSITIADEDQRVKSWNFSAYEISGVSEEKDLKCPPPETVHKDRHELIKDWTYIGNNSVVNVDYNFTLEKCYCFKISPNGYDAHITSTVNYLTSKRCTPLKTYVNPITFGTTLQLHWIIVLILVGLTVLVVAVVIAVIVARNTSSGNRSGRDEKEPMLVGLQRVLIVYARHNYSPDEHVNNIIQRLQQTDKCKIYDIHETMDEEKLEDRNEWIRKRIEQDKILLILSPNLNKLLKGILSSYPNTCDDNQNDDSLLVYCLRSLISDKVIRDYSKVFVVRCPPWIQGEDGEIDVIVERRRYNLPEHWDELLRDMLDMSQP